MKNLNFAILLLAGMTLSCDKKSHNEGSAHTIDPPPKKGIASSIAYEEHNEAVDKGNDTRNIMSLSPGYNHDTLNLYLESKLRELNVDVLDMDFHGHELASQLINSSIGDYIEFIRYNSLKIGNKHYLSNTIIPYYARNNPRDVMSIKDNHDILELIGLDSRDIPRLVGKGIFEKASDGDTTLLTLIKMSNYDDASIIELPDGFFAAHRKNVDFDQISPVIDYIHTHYSPENPAFDQMIVFAASHYPEQTVDHLSIYNYSIDTQTLRSLTLSLYSKDPIRALEYATAWTENEMRDEIQGVMENNLRIQNPVLYNQWIEIKDSR